LFAAKDETTVKKRVIWTARQSHTIAGASSFAGRISDQMTAAI